MEIPFLSSEDYDERAHELYENGEYEAALDLLQDGLRLYPDAPELHIGLGYVRIGREEYVWAKAAFERALELDPEHEDAWVGMGETLLKFGRSEEALDCFACVDALELEDDLEAGLAIGRALYREGLFREARARLSRLADAYPESADAAAALGYTLYALGDDLGASRQLRRSLRLEPTLHDVRIYLAHLLHERGDLRGALAELDRVPPEEHWDPVSVWRFIDLKCSFEGLPEMHASLHPWRARLAELEREPDEIDQLLAEVETAFETGGETGGDPVEVHTVRAADGAVFTGTWEEVVAAMRDAWALPGESVEEFMRRTAERVLELTAEELPTGDPEAFLRESERLGLIRIES